MYPLLISLGAGVLIGMIYALLNVRSPAPPAVALVGLLGMIIGSTLGGKLLYPHVSAALSPHVSIPATALQQPLPPQTALKQADLS